MAPKARLLPPNPSRLIESLRDTGYDFCSALADIVDNSIDAGATDIHVRIQTTPDDELVVSVADNGHGMNEDGLSNAMTYGSISHKESSALGKFGVGLKTASTAFCRRLTVVTRPPNSTVLHKAVLDLDHITNVDKWEILFEDATESEVLLLDEVCHGGQGTLILWEKVDRLGKDESGTNKKNRTTPDSYYANKFREHASAVFQRFIDKRDSRARNISLAVNDKQIDAWDPFLSDNPDSQLVLETNKEVALPHGEKAAFLLRAFILPRKDEFKTIDEHRAARISNNEQGFYIYRENRLISASNWLDMYSKEPHTSLLRIEFSFDHHLDSAFKVDIKKSSLHLNDGLYNWIKDQFVGAPRREAEKHYRDGQKVQTTKLTQNVHETSSRLIGQKAPEIQLAKVFATGKAANEVAVENRYGRIVIRMPVDDTGGTDRICIVPVDSIDDGLLWEPCLHNQQHAIRLNRGHDFYRKVYVPNRSKSVTVQGIDSLLWALAEAELSTINDATRKHFTELRYEVSKLLRSLVEALPEPDLDHKV